MKKRESTSQRRRRGPLAAAGLTVMTLVAMTGIHELMAHGTEAESEMMMYFPAFKVLNTAEITSQHMHNVYTIRGAAVRDASAWAHYIDLALERFPRGGYGDRHIVREG